MNRVTVFDSKGIAIINKIMLLTAQLAINSGKSMEQILIKLTEIKNNYFSLIVPYDLKMFVQGGRISN
jgi:fatty acid-binding protein DegV